MRVLVFKSKRLESELNLNLNYGSRLFRVLGFDSSQNNLSSFERIRIFYLNS